MRAVGEANRSAGAAHLLHGDDMGEVAHIRPAEFLGDRDAMQAERAHLRPEMAGEFIRAVDLGGDRGDARIGEAAHAFAQHVDLLAKAEVEARDGHVAGHGPGSW